MSDEPYEPSGGHPVAEEAPTEPPAEADPDDASQAEPPSTAQSGRLSRARNLHKRYFNLVRLSRLTMLGFVVLAGIFVLWAVPWLPSGLEADDYTPQLAFTVYLLGGLALAGLLALTLQELARRDRESLLVWTAVYDETTGLHTRQYLFDRLSLECERARRTDAVFTVIVIQLHLRRTKDGDSVALPPKALQEVARLIDRLTNPSDMVARLSDSEVAVLAMAADRSSRDALSERLRRAIVGELPRLIDDSDRSLVRAGAVTFGNDGTDERSLIQAARTAAAFGLPAKSHAA